MNSQSSLGSIYRSSCFVHELWVWVNIIMASRSSGEEASNQGNLPRRPSFRELHLKGKDRPLVMSFGGCGFLGVYHVGVGKCVVDHAPHLFYEFDGFYGASAGAITAACAACKSDPMVAYRWVRRIFEESRKYWFGMMSPNFDLYGRLRTFLEVFLPPNAHELCRNVVKISLTIIGEGMPKNWLVSDFRTRTELINVIIASSFIPGYAGFRDLPKIRGKRCCDGGITSNIPKVSDPDVITVTPFSGFCDICPKESCTQHMINLCDQPMQLSPANLYRLAKSLCPTSWKELEDLYHQGYEDCLSFFRNEGLIPNPKVKKLKSSSVLASPSSEGSIPLTTKPSDLPGYRGHSRFASLTLSASGEYFSCFGGSEKNSFQSIPLEEVERGLDLKGTEKATHLIRQYGREEVLQDLINGSFPENKERPTLKRTGISGVMLRIAHPPVQIIKISYRGLSWILQLCYFQEVILHGLSRRWPLAELMHKERKMVDQSLGDRCVGTPSIFIV